MASPVSAGFTVPNVVVQLLRVSDTGSLIHPIWSFAHTYQYREGPQPHPPPWGRNGAGGGGGGSNEGKGLCSVCLLLTLFGSRSYSLCCRSTEWRCGTHLLHNNRLTVAVFGHTCCEHKYNCKYKIRATGHPVHMAYIVHKAMCIMPTTQFVNCAVFQMHTAMCIWHNMQYAECAVVEVLGAVHGVQDAGGGGGRVFNSGDGGSIQPSG